MVFSTINMAALCYIVQSTHHHEMTDSVRFPAVLNSEVGSRWSDILTEKHTNTAEQKLEKIKIVIFILIYNICFVV